VKWSQLKVGLLTCPSGSTNAVLHFLAMAGTAEVPLSLNDIQRVSDKVPFIANLSPSGKYFMEDLHNIGGTPSVLKLLVAAGLIVCPSSSFLFFLCFRRRRYLESPIFSLKNQPETC
jgi:hypothetical protein